MISLNEEEETIQEMKQVVTSATILERKRDNKKLMQMVKEAATMTGGLYFTNSSNVTGVVMRPGAEFITENSKKK
eukprot:14021491-Ditylum_brightwellii.AAC.1